MNLDSRGMEHVGIEVQVMAGCACVFSVCMQVWTSRTANIVILQIRFGPYSTGLSIATNLYDC